MSVSAETILHVPGEVFALPAERGWVLANPRTRTFLGVEAKCLEFLRCTRSRTLSEIRSGWEREQFSLFPLTWFSQSEGILEDPTRLLRSEWPQAESTDLDGMVKALMENCLLIGNRPEYEERFGPKASLFDRKHFGNFHEQLGQHLVTEKRVKPEAWWLDQKFEPGCRELRGNLFGAVQGPALKRYFENRIEPGIRVLDFGCGTGFYANMMAERGASVLGLDPNAEYIATASEAARDGAKFEVADIGKGEDAGLSHLPDESFDLVFMSDTLLFYFIPVLREESHDPGGLLRQVRRILRPDGVFVSVEPHSLFFLQPWLGDIEKPYTVITEYQSREFRIVPTFRELVQAFARHGFVVRWMDELLPHPRFEKTNPRAYHFAREFPISQLFELEKR